MSESFSFSVLYGVRSLQKTKKGCFCLNDEKIVSMYLARDEKAISASSDKYGKYCFAVANNILGNDEDSRECVNDTWLRAWNSIPPAKPSVLKLFLAKITRNLAFDRYKKSHAQKRGEFEALLGELEECILSVTDTESEYSQKELGETITAFLSSLSSRERDIFAGRYYFGFSVRQIAKKRLMSENSVSAVLSRTRKKLKAYLCEKGYTI